MLIINADSEIFSDITQNVSFDIWMNYFESHELILYEALVYWLKTSIAYD